jgi:small GTP-binding protein
MSDDEENDCIPCKVVLLGESGVGKTSILTKFVTGIFPKLVMVSTTSSYVSKNIKVDENYIVKLKLWDTAGQERYRSLAKIFYQNAAAAILVYDIRSLHSFNEIKNYWANEIKSNSPKDIIIAICANKSDDYLEQEVPTQEGKNLAKELNAIFMCTSAKEGTGIEDLFNLIATKFIEPSKDISESFMNKEEIIEQRKKKFLEEKIKNKKIKVETEKNKKNKKKGCCSNG